MMTTPEQNAPAAVYTRVQIEAALAEIAPAVIVDAIAQAFVAYSRGEALIPPPAHLDFDSAPKGDVHLKYGYIDGDSHYVIKVASGFYDNPRLGLPSSGGVMLVFARATGALLAVLLDDGLLTDIRTAAAGAVAAQALAPKRVRCIGIVGAGIQAHLQLRYLAGVTDCRDVVVWGRDLRKLEAYAAQMTPLGFHVTPTLDIETLGKRCNLIVTTTPSRTPLLSIGDLALSAGLHITAVGADGGGKQELAPILLQRADRVVADSLAQCSQHGEISHALKAGMLKREKILELGAILPLPLLHRADDAQVTIADLTGVAVQDIAIAGVLLRALRGWG